MWPFRKKVAEIAGVAYSDKAKNSSAVSDFYAPYVTPYVDFKTAYDYYRTIPEFQNVVEYYVSEILARDWYFEGTPEGVADMNRWAEKFDDSQIVESIVRDWWIFGNSILGSTDWKPVQMTNMLGIKRDAWGNTQEYYLSVNGKPTALLQTYGLSLEDYVHSKFIDANREAWGLSPATALMSPYVDMDGKPSAPQFETFRQIKTDVGKIHHKYASPRTYYFAKGASRDQIEKDIGPLIGSAKPGDRTVISLPAGIDIDLVPETIDGRSRFSASIDLLRNSTDIGLGSSANRLISQPSSMADAREANVKDDTRTLGMMEKIRRLFNSQIIPRITNEQVEFRWGQKDSFDLDFAKILQLAEVKIDNKSTISVQEYRQMLVKKGILLDNSLFSIQEFLQKYPKSESFVNFEYNDCHGPDGRFCSGSGSSGGKKGHVGRKKPEPVEYPDAERSFLNYAAKTDKDAYTFDPATGKGYDVFESHADAQDLYDNYGDGEHELFIVADTNHLGDPDRETESAYYQTLMEGRNPFFGPWKEQETGFEYTDISSARNLTEELNIINDKMQSNAVVIDKYGKARFLR